MYSEKDKTIFQFPNSTLKIDPLELRRKLLIHSNGQLHDLVNQFNSGSELESAQAEDALVRAVRAALGLKGAAEPGGHCDATVLEYLASYLEWLLRPHEQRIKMSLTSPPCTDCPPPPFPT